MARRAASHNSNLEPLIGNMRKRPSVGHQRLIRNNQLMAFKHEGSGVRWIRKGQRGVRESGWESWRVRRFCGPPRVECQQERRIRIGSARVRLLIDATFNFLEALRIQLGLGRRKIQLRSGTFAQPCRASAAPSMPGERADHRIAHPRVAPCAPLLQELQEASSKAKFSAAVGAFLPDIRESSKSPVTLYARKCSSFPSGRGVGYARVSGNSEPMQIARMQSAAAALTHPDWRAALITFQMTIAARSLHVVRTQMRMSRTTLLPHALVF